MELLLSEADRLLYKKLWASASDIEFARQCAQHVRRKAWYRGPWSRGTTYFQQSAYITSLVVAYARPFTPGRGGRSFPAKLIPYAGQEVDLHRRLLKLRHEIYAHTDLKHWTARPWRSGKFETAITNQPVLVIDHADLERFIGMSGRLLVSIRSRIAQIEAAY